MMIKCFNQLQTAHRGGNEQPRLNSQPIEAGLGSEIRPRPKKSTPACICLCVYYVYNIDFACIAITCVPFTNIFNTCN